MRVVGSCIRSVVAILPVGSITPVGIRNFYIPGNPGSPDWLSALRLPAFLASAWSTLLFPDLFFLPCAALRRSWEFHIQLPCGFRLLRPCIQSIIGNLLMRESQLFYLPGFATCFSLVLGFQHVSLSIHIFNLCALNTLRCACSSIPCGQSVQGASCPLTLSCIPAFKSASANYSCEL